MPRQQAKPEPGTFALLRATHMVMAHVERALAGEEALRLPHAMILVCLQRAGASTMSELQSLTRIRPSTATGLVQQLEDRGYLSRQRNPHDRRSWLVSLTPTGKRTAATASRALAELDAKLEGAGGEVAAALRDAARLLA